MQSEITRTCSTSDRASPDSDQLLAIMGGRALMFSPPWNGEHASVLFDCNSGDYWLLSPLAREIVRHATDTAPQDVATLIRHVAGRPGGLEDWDGSEATILRVIDELVRLQILAHT